MYYGDKLGTLQDLFGTMDVRVEPERLVVAGREYPIVDDVIVLLPPEQRPPSVTARIGGSRGAGHDDFAEHIQFTFGAEWQRFPGLMAEHRQEFDDYFDLVDVDALSSARVCDLGCGMGRWSHFVRDRCRELVLVDFSDAIFVARTNLRDASNALFFMGDIRRLPFRDDFADFAYCLGVLHTFATDACDAVRGMRRYAPRLLVYLYYDLDNRPFYFRVLLAAVTAVRAAAARVRSHRFRDAFVDAVARLVYIPLVRLGEMLRTVGLERLVPLHEAYAGKSLERVRQDVYDRFFTGTERRYRLAQIDQLSDSFSRVTVSNGIPYWHFLCER